MKEEYYAKFISRNICVIAEIYEIWIVVLLFLESIAATRIKENRHEVKNNMQTVVSLLRMQSEQLTDPDIHWRQPT
jgi:two-component sensor histidine kinase